MFNGIGNPGWWAGIAIAVLVSAVAGYAADWVGISLLNFEKSPISAIMMAIVLGMIVANSIRMPDSWQPGLKFCTTAILKIGIMLLGIRLSLLSAGQFTLVALPFVIAAIAAGLLTVGLIGKYMGLSKQLSGLIAVGTSICGCTAIVATAPIDQGKRIRSQLLNRLHYGFRFSSDVLLSIARALRVRQSTRTRGIVSGHVDSRNRPGCRCRHDV